MNAHEPLSQAGQGALRHAAEGWPVFSCNARTKGPLTEHSFKDATTDSLTIEAWWRQHPQAMIGVPTGAATGMFVLDVDRDPEKGIDGAVSLAALESERGASFGLPSNYGEAALREECDRVRTASEGTRNSTLNWAAFSLAQLVAGGELGETEVQRRLIKAAVACGLDTPVAERTIAIGFTAGVKEPRCAPPPEPGPDRQGKSGKVSVDIGPGEPLPLFPPPPPAAPYPLAALGPTLSRAASAIASKVQVPDSMAAQSVLAVASLATQAIANVQPPFERTSGQTSKQSRPLSLYTMTIAMSGDRKTSCDNEALWPVRKREKALRERYEVGLEDWRIDHTAWASHKKKIENKGDLTVQQRKDQLRNLGPEPKKPLLPLLIMPDPTLEGLYKLWSEAPPSLGLFTSEGATFIGGYSMAAESKLRTAAGLSDVWQGTPVVRARVHDGFTSLVGRRLAMHLMIQPKAAAKFLSDPAMQDQGILSRVLLAMPDSLAGARPFREAREEEDEAIRAYGARILALLEMPLPLAAGKANELEPPTLTLSPEARALWIEFHNYIETRLAKGKELHAVREFAGKASEQATRIAAVLTIVEDARATTIGERATRAAITLMGWYVGEVLRLQSIGRTDPELVMAQELLDWIQARGDSEVKASDILRLGPQGLRNKKDADRALTILVDHGWLVEIDRRPRRLRVVREARA